MPDLLIELFSEEIPARMQARAAQNLKDRMTNALVEAGLTYAGAAAFATPRRLALAVDGLLAESPTQHEERKGPRVDAPEQAIEGFLRGAGVAREDLEIRDEKKGQIYFATITRPGRPAAEIVGRGAGGCDPQLSLAQIHALGVGQPALGAAPAFDPVHPDRRGGRSQRGPLRD